MRKIVFILVILFTVHLSAQGQTRQEAIDWLKNELNGMTYHDADIGEAYTYTVKDDNISYLSSSGTYSMFVFFDNIVSVKKSRYDDNRIEITTVHGKVSEISTSNYGVIATFSSFTIKLPRSKVADLDNIISELNIIASDGNENSTNSGSSSDDGNNGGSSGSSNNAHRNCLNIQPIAQTMTEWCWLTVCQMVLQYHGVCAVNTINYQCGIVAYLSPQCNMNCFSCDVPAYSLSEIQAVLYNYPIFASQRCGYGRIINSKAVQSTIDKDVVQMEIDNGCPIIIGIKNGQHAVLIIGYNITSDGTFNVIINDPWPYARMQQNDPYTQNQGIQLLAGRYQIEYSALVNNVNWVETVYNIR